MCIKPSVVFLKQFCNLWADGKIIPNSLMPWCDVSLTKTAAWISGWWLVCNYIQIAVCSYSTYGRLPQVRIDRIQCCWQRLNARQPGHQGLNWFSRTRGQQHWATLKNGLLIDIYWSVSIIWYQEVSHIDRVLIHGGGNWIYGLHVIIHNRLFAEGEVLGNFRGLSGPRTRTRTCKMVLEDPRGQGLSLRSTTLRIQSSNSLQFTILKTLTQLWCHVT